MGNQFCGQCQNMKEGKNQLRQNGADKNRSEKKQNQAVQILQISSILSSSIKNEMSEHKKQNQLNNKEQSTGFGPTGVAQMDSGYDNFLPIQSKIQGSSFLKRTGKMNDIQNSYNSNVLVPYSVIKLLMKKQIFQQINFLMPQFQLQQKQDKSSLGITQWKLQKQGFYVNELINGEYMIVTQNQFYHGWTANNTFIPENKGLLITKSGYYDGNFLAGRAQGRGKFISYNKSTKFIGNWQKGEFVKGKVQNQNFIYDGTLKKSKPQGQGTLICQNPKLKLSFKYQGNFYDGKFSGEGKYQCSAYLYIGSFKNGKKSGYGILTAQSLVTRIGTAPTKIVLKGEWQQDKFKEQEKKK